jgi:hypothetical protein
VWRIPFPGLLAFPLARITLETPLAQYAVFKRLQDAVEPRKWWRLSRSHRDFEGVVSHIGFKVFRIIHHRNSFLPVVVGTIQPRVQGGTRIEVLMRMTWLTIVLMALWMGFAAALLVCGLWAMGFGAVAPFVAHAGTAAIVAAAAGMLVAGYAMSAISFNVEARRARTLLARIVDKDTEGSVSKHSPAIT